MKPLEGSETLGKWKKLATPHLGVILESHTGVQNRVLQGVDKDLVDYALKKDSPEDGEQTVCAEFKERRRSADSSFKESHREDCLERNRVDLDRFGTTSSVFTFTTTSLSQNNDITSVTPSLSKLQLATGQHLPITSISSSPVPFNNNSTSTAATKQNETVGSFRQASIVFFFDDETDTQIAYLFLFSRWWPIHLQHLPHRQPANNPQIT